MGTYWKCHPEKKKSHWWFILGVKLYLCCTNSGCLFLGSETIWVVWHQTPQHYLQRRKEKKKQQNRKLHSNDVFNNDNLIGGIFQWHQFLITARSMALQRSVSLQCTWLRQGLSGSQQHRLLNSGSPNFSYSFSESAWPAQMRLLAGQNGPLLFWKCSLGGVWRYVKSNILPLHPTGRVNETQFPIRKSSGFHRASPNKN